MALGTELDRFAAQHLRTWGGVDGATWTTVDGTLCFVDISGFTALSEKLATLGRVGAEELTEVLNRVFGDMLELSANRGGTLLKYGGDALLLLFEGEDHPIQAASATVEMRASLRTAADVPTSVGRVPLRMSQGVHTGWVHLFKATGSHTELIVAGPCASHVAQMEGTADAGEIVISAATRDRLGSHAAPDAKGEGWILKWRTARVDPCGPKVLLSPSDETAGADVATLIPTGLRPFLSSGSPDSEHRHATVAFVKVRGTDDVLKTHGPDATAEAIDAIVGEIIETADGEELTFLATDVDENGFKVILVSGVPRTRVDESGRALRAVRRIADINTPFDVKIGVNRGDVFCGEVGSSLRSTYTIMGDTVNLAARLMAAAPSGEIYSTRSAIDDSLTLFASTEVAPFHVKGKAEPVRALSIGGETGTRSSHSTGTAFVGRKAELERITGVIADLTPGKGSAFTVSGPTGIGKTRLIEESLAGVRTAVIEVRSEPYGSANPYRPWRDALRSLLGVERASQQEMAVQVLAGVERIAPHLVAFAPLIGDVAHVDLDATPETAAIESRFRSDRTVEVVVEFLELANPGACVIAAEDIHWADTASLALLERLAAGAKRRGWLVLATSQDQTLAHSTAIALEPLSEDEAIQMVHAATEAAPLRPDVASTIVRRSGGSPLFIEELVAIVRDTGDVSSLPMSLDGVVGSQIDNLPPLARRVLRYLAVLGRSFRIKVARDLLRGQGIVLDDATRSTLATFLDDDGSGRLEFRHSMVRDVAYEGLSYRLRRELHLAAGHLLLESVAGDEDSAADMLALHFSEGGDAEVAWRFARTAGDRNRDLFANSAAASQYERALLAARRLDGVADADRFEVWTRLGDVREQLGQFQSALEAYRRASTYAHSSPIDLCEVLIKRASAKERAGRYAAALAEATKARKLAESVGGPEMQQRWADAIGMAAVIRQAQQKPVEARKAAEAAVEAAKVANDELALARALSVLDYSLVMLGDLDKATNSNESLEIYRTHGKLDEEGQVAQNLGVYAYWRGDWNTALEMYRQGRTTLERVGNIVEVARADANIGEVLVNQAKFAEAEEPLFDARRIYSASGFDEGIAFVDVLIGRMYGLRGDLERSARYLESAIDASRGLQLDAHILEASIHLADAACRSGDPHEGLAILERAADEAPAEYLEFFLPLFARVNGSVLDAAGDTDRALEVLDQGLTEATERGDVYEAALLVEAIERIDDRRIDEASRVAARETLRTLGVRSASGDSVVVA